ncbi:MAG: hypothetical protein F6K28_43455 [Microcoleus sp. SIO2G3]|nr:hypothetical protein [Microcoleus sp. SIO2G3]
MANATPNGERHAKGVSERECVCLWHSAPPEEARSRLCRETLQRALSHRVSLNQPLMTTPGFG